MTWILIPMAFLLVMHVFMFGRVLGRLSPASIFIYMQFLMALGTIPTLDVLERADNVHAWLIFGSFLAFVGTSAVLAFLVPPRPARIELNYARSERWVRPRGAISVWCAISILISLIYYSAIGYNVLAVGLGNAFAGNTNDVTTLRLQAYAGGEYFYPGYVNQFKNSLLPALVCVITAYLFVRKSPARWVTSSALTMVTMVFLLGTGQRGAFVIFMIILAIFISLMNPAQGIRRMVILAGITIPVFSLSTVALGRSSYELSTAVGLFDKIAVIGNEIIFRILGSNQLASTTGFRYIYTMPQKDGAEWGQSLIGLLPGVPGSTLSNEIFAALYGSMRGTAPPSIWGSFFHNFGFQYTLVLAGFLAVIYHLVGRSISQTRHPNSLQAIGMAGVTGVLGTWVAGSPDYLLNVGLMVYIVLWAVGARTIAKSLTLPSAHTRDGDTGRVKKVVLSRRSR